MQNPTAKVLNPTSVQQEAEAITQKHSGAIEQQQLGVMVQQRPGTTVQQQPGAIAQHQPRAIEQQQPIAMVHQWPGTTAQQQPEAIMQQQHGVIEQQQPGAIKHQHPGAMVQQRPGTTMQQQPGAITQQQPGAMVQQRPGTIAKQPVAIAQQQPGAIEQQHPGAIVQQRPGTTAQQQLGAIEQQHPGTIAHQQPVATVQPQPGAIVQQQPGATAQQQPGVIPQQQPEAIMEHQSAAITHKAKLKNKYCVMYQNNNSKSWDGCEIWLDSEYMETLYDPSMLIPGVEVSLPWKGKNATSYWNAVIIDPTIKEESKERCKNKQKKTNVRTGKGKTKKDVGILAITGHGSGTVNATDTVDIKEQRSSTTIDQDSGIVQEQSMQHSNDAQFIKGNEFSKLLDQQQQMINLLSNLVQYNMQHAMNNSYQPFSSQQCSTLQHNIEQRPPAVHNTPSFNLPESLSLLHSTLTPDQQANQNVSLQPQQQFQLIFQQQYSIQQPTTPQQQSNIQTTTQALSLANKNAVHTSMSTLPTEQMSFQQDPCSYSHGKNQSFSSDDLLSEIENSTDDLEFLSTSWPEQKQAIPPPPSFLTSPKLQPVDKVMQDHPGSDVAKLRELAIALARDAIFGKEELIKCSLSGRKNTGSLDRKKLDYIKMVVHTRHPTMSEIDFEQIWALCKQSISKSCQTLGSNARRKL